jgi:hypothetical protein
VKQRLSQTGTFAMAEYDAVELEHIEDYLMFDPFISQPETNERQKEHPWNRVYGAIQSEVMHRGLQREIQKIDWSNLKKE